MFNYGGTSTANYYGDPNVMGSYTVNPGVTDMYNERLDIANAIKVGTPGWMQPLGERIAARQKVENDPRYKKINYELTGEGAEYATAMDAMFDIKRPTSGTIYRMDMNDLSKNPNLMSKLGGQPCFECGGSLKRYQGTNGSSEVEMVLVK
jgi:hypothetical protein